MPSGGIIKQIPEKEYTFRCGCTGILPRLRYSNKFAKWHKHRRTKRGGCWECRIASAINVSSWSSIKYVSGYPIDLNTPHSMIQSLPSKTCWVCSKALRWNVEGREQRPHIHHDHSKKRNNVLGYVHPKCNLTHIRDIITKLRKQIKRLTNIKNHDRV